ncbi:hypothetical protein SNOG_05014 [Parastagonospora nodorum SN15]|uniref:Uncharacterized protein n=1 Tax=Phaeosphaeria nodorum (strain SN15 / ATCC MYA-4574 / FGSC 10173) TaxID=321614 RepID=Q0UTA0_PHANO|nr:hypothetical protein SNOG_05014 [Parastagonospora nodorum SN15]EAT87405.1 hypothetical protein SNOG_05014 [Parastagonospora nodorum SN15]
MQLDSMSRDYELDPEHKKAALPAAMRGGSKDAADCMQVLRGIRLYLGLPSREVRGTTCLAAAVTFSHITI